jgi:MFS family permease
MLPVCCSPRHRGAGLWRSPCSARGIAALDATVVSIALPAIGREFRADVGALQRIVSGYTLTLAAFPPVGGPLSDRFGRRRTYSAGDIWFALAPAACRCAPGAGVPDRHPVLQGADAPPRSNWAPHPYAAATLRRVQQ